MVDVANVLGFVEFRGICYRLIEIQNVLMNSMSQIFKSVITYIILIGCICVHVSESSVTKGVLPLFTDTFDKVRITDSKPGQLFPNPGFGFGLPQAWVRV